MNDFKLFIRNLIKAILQFGILPIVYKVYKKKNIQENLVIFADSKNDGIPYSMFAMYKTINNTGKYDVKVLCSDYSKLNILEKAKAINRFMKLYANAKYVFICDYFLPVSSCNKRKETKVIQLWHASGLQKKFGYDAADDLGKLKYVNPVKNFDLVSVSSKIMIDVIANNWKLDRKKIKAMGTSRSDVFYDKQYLKECKIKFYNKYPNAIGQKIILWAPSFRGNGSNAKIDYVKQILDLKAKLSDKYYFIIKLHPHLQKKYNVDNCAIPTEELYPVIDILITDYSSVLFDYLLLNKNVIFYVPDYKDYIKTRGLYINYWEEFEFPIVYSINELHKTICNYPQLEDIKVEMYKNKFIKNNDGQASKRIINYLERIYGI